MNRNQILNNITDVINNSAKLKISTINNFINPYLQIFQSPYNIINKHQFDEKYKFIDYREIINYDNHIIKSLEDFFNNFDKLKENKKKD